eukprot:TRINITY_DN7273_c1_g1_i1.p2 TRINITY_DN7273_c1_g1~~TRINITY_DN7273_c1_g1_i1.p2  ORF type:complete len:104 (+),score=45.30 TRINITY_DN7273_c1_g1_i1:381-692(+)
MLPAQEKVNFNTCAGLETLNSQELQQLQNQLKRLYGQVKANKERLAKEAKAHEETELQCKRCVVNKSTTVVFPCAHRSLCDECAISVTHCPSCQQTVDFYAAV